MENFSDGDLFLKICLVDSNKVIVQFSEEVEINRNFKYDKLKYIFKNLMGYNKTDFYINDIEMFKILRTTHDKLNLNHALTDRDKEKISNINQILKLIQYKLRNTSKLTIQFKYENFIFNIRHTSISSCLCIVSRSKPKIMNKVFKYLISINKFDKLFDMIEKYHITTEN